MINLVERLRKESKVSKAELYHNCKVSQGMYYKYLKGSNIPVDVFKSFLDYLGYELTAVKKDSIVKL